MKLVTYVAPGTAARSGVLVDENSVLDLAGAANACGLPLPTDIIGLLDMGMAGMERAAYVVNTAQKLGVPTIPLGEARLLAPIPRPRKVLLLAGNYAAHIQEGGGEAPEKSTTNMRPFIKPSNSVIGPDAPILYPRWSKTPDYELELCIVVGRQATAVSAQDAKQYIAGYAVFNDISARSLIIAEGRKPRDGDDFFDWLLGKWCDTFSVFGPAITTADAVADPHNLHLWLDVNGERRQDANTAQLIFNCYEVVSFISHVTTLEPGDIIATGTPAGVGATTDNYLKVGDVIEATVDGLGTLRNTLVAAS
ncbi:MAG: fumarylacetoacetate hydrolase family protein [Chloroflexi bacterium]|nr:fumarylacetoacetate hydrolase family protein [Chloroflexota bacterium]